MGKKSNPVLSVVMNNYNAQDFIGEAIESILSQSFTDFEFLITDDGSTDASVTIIESYAKKDKRINVFLRGKNPEVRCGRLVENTNAAFREAKGKYIAILDSDDCALAERLKTQISFLEEHPEIYLVAGSYIRRDEQGEELGRTSMPMSSEEVLEQLPKKSLIVHSSVCFRNTQEFFHREKLSRCNDYDFYLQILAAGKKICVLSNFLVKYTVRSNSISSQGFMQQKKSMELAKHFFQERIKKGKDAYEELDDEKEIWSLKESLVSYEKRVVKESFRDNKMNRVRKEIFHLWKKKHFSLWSLVYFGASFTPLKLLTRIRKHLWK